MTELHDRLAALAADPVRPLDLAAVRGRAGALRRRSRMVRGAAGGIVVAATIVVAAVAVGDHRVASHVTVTAPVHRQTRPTVPIFRGYPTDADVSSNVTFAGSRGMVLMTGRATSGGHSYAVAWPETTADGGLHWTPGRIGPDRGAAAARDIRFVDPSDGWAYGNGYGLYATNDGGAHWSEQLSGQDAGLLTTSGRSAWVVVLRTCGKYSCGQLDSIAEPGASPRRLVSQPPGVSNMITLLRPTASTALALTRTSSDRESLFHLSVTEDGGRHWEDRAIPCERPANRTAGGGGPGAIASTSSDSLWLTCQRPTDDVDSASLSIVYRSIDEGRTWQRLTPHLRFAQDGEGLGDTVVALDPASAAVLWALEADSETDAGTLLRSADSGRTWRRLLPTTSPGHGYLEPIAALTVTSADDGWIAADFPRSVLLHTTDGGVALKQVRLPLPE